MQDVERPPEDLEPVEKGLGRKDRVAQGRPNRDCQGTVQDGDGIQEGERLAAEKGAGQEDDQEQDLDHAPALGRWLGWAAVSDRALARREPLEQASERAEPPAPDPAEEQGEQQHARRQEEAGEQHAAGDARDDHEQGIELSKEIGPQPAGKVGRGAHRERKEGQEDEDLDGLPYPAPPASGHGG